MAEGFQACSFFGLPLTKEAVGIHVLLTRSLFRDGILRRLLRRVSLAELLALCRADGCAERSLNFGLRGAESRKNYTPQPVQFG
jgi:hypothetical protein